MRGRIFLFLLMQKPLDRNAYIDGANLYSGVRSQGWKLDYRRFRVWLKEKFGVRHAYLFLGFIQAFASVYESLRDAGFILVFKEVVYDGNGKAKGNCDADLVLQSVVDCFEDRYKKAVIVSSDGDFTSLVRFLYFRNKLEMLISPANERDCSILLKKLLVPTICLSEIRSAVSLK
jgi:uncharacterized LabA/DUF88 family protein